MSASLLRHVLRHVESESHRSRQKNEYFPFQFFFFLFFFNISLHLSQEKYFFISVDVQVSLRIIYINNYKTQTWNYKKIKKSFNLKLSLLNHLVNSYKGYILLGHKNALERKLNYLFAGKTWKSLCSFVVIYMNNQVFFYFNSVIYCFSIYFF